MERIQKYNINVLKKAAENNKKLRDRYYKIIIIMSYLIESTSVSGVILLLIFAIQFAQNLIW